MFYQLFIFSLFFSFISLFLSFFLPFLFFLIPFSSSELWDFTTLFCIVLGCYSYMFKKKGLRHRHRRRSAEFQAQLPVRYLSGDSKFKPKSMPAVDSKSKPKSMTAVDSKFKPKSMPAVQRISYLDSVSNPRPGVAAVRDVAAVRPPPRPRSQIFLVPTVGPHRSWRGGVRLWVWGLGLSWAWERFVS